MVRGFARRRPNWMVAFAIEEANLSEGMRAACASTAMLGARRRGRHAQRKSDRRVEFAIATSAIASSGKFGGCVERRANVKVIAQHRFLSDVCRVIGRPFGGEKIPSGTRADSELPRDSQLQLI
jgi:hypothetical protein